MNDHAHVNTIHRYYTGCSTGDVELMKSTFTADVTHYFIGHEPVRTAEALALYWKELNDGDDRYTWTVDHSIVSGDEVVIEWTMRVTFNDGRHPEILRGAEWYEFRDGKIAEIRAYYRWPSEELVSELVDFPYAKRGYPTFSNP